MPSVSQFWDNLTLVWVNRLAQAADDSKWRRIFYQQMSRALNRNNLTFSDFQETGTATIASVAASRLTNRFWKEICVIEEVI